MEQWRASGDTGFIRFLGSNALPTLNPLVALPGFSAARAAVGALLASGNVTEFEAKLADFCAAERGAPRFPAAAIGSGERASARRC